MIAELITFPHAVPVVSPHDQTIRIQRNTYADSLRSIRKTRDMWRKKEREAVFSKAGMNLYAEATQRAAMLLRFHIVLTVPPRPR